jgi:hypothetical protein
MKTIVIWDNCDADLKFFVVEGDFRHLNRKYINSMDATDEEVDEINALVFNEDGSTKVKMFDMFPDELVAGAQVVIMGFLP